MDYFRQFIFLRAKPATVFPLFQLALRSTARNGTAALRYSLGERPALVIFQCPPLGEAPVDGTTYMRTLTETFESPAIIASYLLV